MSGDNKKLGTTSNTALAALSQTPYNFAHGTTFSTMGLRWDQYLSLRERGLIVERQFNGNAPDVAITPLGVAAQGWVGTSDPSG